MMSGLCSGTLGQCSCLARGNPAASCLRGQDSSGRRRQSRIRPIAPPHALADERARIAVLIDGLDVGSTFHSEQRAARGNPLRFVPHNFPRLGAGALRNLRRIAGIFGILARQFRLRHLTKTTLVFAPEFRRWCRGRSFRALGKPLEPRLIILHAVDTSPSAPRNLN